MSEITLDAWEAGKVEVAVTIYDIVNDDSVSPEHKLNTVRDLAEYIINNARKRPLN